MSVGGLLGREGMRVRKDQVRGDLAKRWISGAAVVMNGDWLRGNSITGRRATRLEEVRDAVVHSNLNLINARRAQKRAGSYSRRHYSPWIL